MSQNSLKKKTIHQSCLICHAQSRQSSICKGCESLLFQSQNTCVICGIKTQQKDEVCGECQKATPYFSKVISVCDYVFPADDWIKGLKFANQLNLSKLMAELIFKKIGNQYLDYEFTSIPLHKNRLRTRGYNQSYEIALELTKISGQKLVHCMQRVKDTKMQAQLKFSQRQKNVKKAFEVVSDIKGKKLLIIDDVLTSGQTMNEASKTLIQSKAKDVIAVVFARKQP